MVVNAPDKCVIVVDGDLPVGLALNTAAILSLTIGRHVDGVLGDDVKDADGFAHRGITSLPVPILRGDAAALAALVVKAAAVPEVFVVDFTRTAQTSRTYDEYISRMAEIGTGDLPYVGVGIAGPKKPVDRLVGNFALYR
ncbi:DUF2000 domain-containing protein [Saccharothrix syringae]|uniref:DUF2000 domain-containing protein n=1 Tax=Saccharothrix syringae TaxID=103733 RepID=A0A5Q0GYN2_SACSY|nr:DUF2000 domain-containing protein [Saccharothrix syringae]QFZ19111.1 DUF2000 domain-containing protein [Saccharothrix syringae]